MPRTFFPILIAVLLIATGCSNQEKVGGGIQSSSDSLSSPSAQVSSSEPASQETNSTNQSQSQVLYDGGQEDPTILGFPKAPWEHIEYKNFGNPDSWETFERKAYQYEKGAEIGDSLVLTFKLPTRVSVDGTFDYDGDFTKGNIKIGDGFSTFAPLAAGETAANNTNEQYSKAYGIGQPEKDQTNPITQTTENIVGGYCYGSRGTVSFARYVVGGVSPENNMLEYVVQLGDRYLTSAYFYVSENATADDLKLYDEIVFSLKIKE